MTLNVEVIMKETILPSSPTPNHLQTFKLSSIDQSLPAHPVCVLLFYSSAEDELYNEMRIRRLKESLPEILTVFYPFAGRIVENKVINCTDEGINFFQTRVSAQLSQVLSQPIWEELVQLSPEDDFSVNGAQVILSVQVNIFDCGGICVAVAIHHKAADASSISLFLNSWAMIARGEAELIVRPKFDTSSLFHPKEVEAYSTTTPAEGNQIKKIVCKRFVFDASSINALKEKCSNSNSREVPTRVEAVSALLWMCAMNAARKKAGHAKLLFLAVVLVNIRGRMSPPLPNHYVGNLIAAEIATSTQSEPQLHCLVGQLREATRKVDGEYCGKLQREEVPSAYPESYEGEIKLYGFSSWCRFPFYGANFGWGKPGWVTPTATLRQKNIILLMDTKCGRGVETLVSLDEEDMALFQCDPALITFISHPPN